MNRKERRAAVKRDKNLRLPASAGQRKNASGLVDLIATARQHYQQGRLVQAEDACRQVLARQALARDPAQRDALNLLGLMSQAANRHDRAVVLFARALKSGDGDAVCHFNIASSYQELARRNEASAHFTRAMALGLDPHFIMQCVARTPVVAACLVRLAQAWPRRLTMAELFGSAGVAAIADQVLLQCALKSIWICDQEFENFLTHLRYVLLQLTAQRVPDVSTIDDMQVELFGALARQCFINEYVFDQTEDETRQAIALRDLLNERLAAGGEVPALLFVAVAAYFPLHSLEMAHALLRRGSDDPIGDLIDSRSASPLRNARIANAFRRSPRSTTASHCRCGNNMRRIHFRAGSLFRRSSCSRRNHPAARSSRTAMKHATS
jgi:tetratricopeptide (TPR) repeat protein